MSSADNKAGALRILMADDHFIIRTGLRLILESEPGFVLVGEAKDGATAVRLAGELRPDIVLMDLRMPGMDGLQAIEQIRKDWPDIAVVILTTYNDAELMLKGLRAGAAGYLLKDVDRETLFRSLRAAARGETLMASAALERALKNAFSHYPAELARKSSESSTAIVLTSREQAVLEAVARGERNKEIAMRLGISEPTVKSHLTSLYAKLNVDSRASAVAVAVEQGLLSLVKKANQLSSI